MIKLISSGKFDSTETGVDVFGSWWHGRGTGRVRAYGFMESGESYILEVLPGEDRHTFVASTGVGTR